MKQLTLPVPPNPDDAAYVNSPLAFSRAQFQWATEVRGVLQQQSRVNHAPMGQAFSVGTYTTTTAVSGTTTGTDLSNFVSTLVHAMQSKGLTSPTASRTQTT